jgi:hypothetical protein
MKKLLIVAIFTALFAACNSKTGSDKSASDSAGATGAAAKDTLTYEFKATYSSDITVPGNPVIAQKVLQVWKMFETNQVDSMKPYFADSVIYEDASGMRYNGPTAGLLAFAKKDIENLDSMRFDISTWQSAHVNDKNEDWVNIWSTERRYPRNGKADTVLMQENWKVKDVKVIYFNQFLARMKK